MFHSRRLWMRPPCTTYVQHILTMRTHSNQRWYLVQLHVRRTAKRPHAHQACGACGRQCCDITGNSCAIAPLNGNRGLGCFACVDAHAMYACVQLWHGRHNRSHQHIQAHHGCCVGAHVTMKLFVNGVSVLLLCIITNLVRLDLCVCVCARTGSCV